MKNTCPYPTSVEMEDIKAAYEYLFDSIRFKEDDKNCELYSATIENISEKLEATRLMLGKELTLEQLSLPKMSKEVFGIKLKYIEGTPKIHGMYDSDNDVMYINGNMETSLN